MNKWDVNFVRKSGNLVVVTVFFATMVYCLFILGHCIYKIRIQSMMGNSSNGVLSDSARFGVCNICGKSHGREKGDGSGIIAPIFPAGGVF